MREPAIQSPTVSQIAGQRRALGRRGHVLLVLLVSPHVPLDVISSHPWLIIVAIRPGRPDVRSNRVGSCIRTMTSCCQPNAHREHCGSRQLTQREDDANLVVPYIQLRHRLLDIRRALSSILAQGKVVQLTQAAPEKLWLPMYIQPPTPSFSSSISSALRLPLELLLLETPRVSGLGSNNAMRT